VEQIVEKESGILGYPQESSSPLNADHHTICKFENREDPNYITIRNLIKYWASRPKFRVNKLPTSDHSAGHLNLPEIQRVLGINEPAQSDLETLHSKVLSGTCQWMTIREDFLTWREMPLSSNAAVYWLIGLPATGKTSITKAVIDHLRSLGLDCAYHFFAADHQQKRTTSYCLRSVALQLAEIDDSFGRYLAAFLKESGVKLDSSSQSFDIMWERIFEGIAFKSARTTPLFIILDAVDEADAPSPLLNRLIGLKSIAPIKIFLASRPMKVPPKPGNISITTCLLQEQNTAEDILSYAQRFLEDALPDDPGFHQHIIQQILAKSSGSFLWVKLTLETLQNSWHTRDDIQAALTEIPKGMEELYSKMLSGVRSQAARLQTMAQRILTWSICSWRPLSIAELQKALEPEFRGFVNLEYTITQICGHFITVTNRKIALVHATARDFLLASRDGSPPFIERRDGHQLLATACLRTLSSDEWQASTRMTMMASKRSVAHTITTLAVSPASKDETLWTYATCHWAYHVSMCSSRSQDVANSLNLFLNRYALSWIEAVALLGDLRYMVRSAQYLKAYAKKRSRGSNIDGTMTLLSLEEPPPDGTKLLHSFANDFVRIVGKFGANLLQQPSSIYRLVLPFCPQQSAVANMERHLDLNSIKVTGFVLEGWGDCLASMTVGNDHTASQVLATDALFVALISSSGTVVLWSVETYTEVRRLSHDEYVTTMTLSKSKTLLATSGFATYRVWEMASGVEAYRISRFSDFLTVALEFSIDDSELIIGLDNSSIACYDLQTSAVKSTFYASHPTDSLSGCPSTITLSQDRKKVAISWRGQPLIVWDMQRDSPPQTCKVVSKSDPLNAPEIVKWKRDGNSILILCLSAKLFEWNVQTLEQIEHGKYHDMNAREMDLSADESLLLTSDASGTMSVWSFPRLNLIYQLVNTGEYIRDISLSPDGRRFYDVRGSMCNVWEPDSLIRPDYQDTEDTSSVAESFAATEPVVLADEISGEQVTALFVSSDDLYYCCGKDDGTVIIHDAHSGEKIRKLFSYSKFNSVTLIEWSVSGRYLFCSSNYGRVVGKRLEVKAPGKWAVFPVIDLEVRESILQLVFSRDERLLLISTNSHDYVWDLKLKTQLCKQNQEQRGKGKWFADPMNPEVVLWINGKNICQYLWATLQHNDIETHPPRELYSQDVDSIVVKKVALTANSRNVVYEVAPRRPSDYTSIWILSTSSLSYSWKADLSGKVRLFLGMIDDKVVFLDYDHWLCTWEIDTQSADIKRHFFLPSDLLNTGALELARHNVNGTFYFPKFGNVIVIRDGLRL
jgi:WD40 repeat protein